MNRVIKKRDLRFDFLRVISMSFVVFILHFSQYTKASQWWSSPIALIFTNISLSSFTLISGYFACAGYKGKPVEYYRNRFLRIYPLFFLSSILLYYIGDITSKKELLFTLIGHAGCLYGKSPRTVWYICMLLMFYLITPVILKTTNKKSFLLIGLICIVLFSGFVYLGNADVRVLLYFPLYFAGMYVRRFNLIPEYKKSYLLIGLLCAVAMAVLAYVLLRLDLKGLAYLVFIPSSAFSVFVLWQIADRLSHLHFPKPMVDIFSNVAYASFCMYLFHRPIYYGLTVLWGGMPWIALVFLIPLLTFVSFVIQYYYDYIVKIINRRVFDVS